MSCSHPITIYTNARTIKNGVSRWRNTFPCGCCAGCVNAMRKEWRLRGFYEAKSCLRNKGSFILFDTLTYCDDYLRYYSDIFPELNIPSELDGMSFSRGDLQGFFKRLRINLDRDGYDIDGNLRYLVSSEYGSAEYTDGFQNTHRPHYHILFYVNFSIDPIELSRYISEAWQFGKTDGVKPFDDCSLCPLRKYCRGRCLYQTPEYVENERVIRVDSTANCIKAVNYVTKYISKDLFNWINLSENVNRLFDCLFPGWRESYELSRFYRKFRSQVLPFHLQSRGFGLFALENEDMDYIISCNAIRMPSSDSDAIKSIPLPKYFERKLFYNLSCTLDGRLAWVLNDFGKSVKVSQIDKKIEVFKREYRVFDRFISKDKLEDLALYNCVYRGTLCRKKDLFLPYKKFYSLLLSLGDRILMHNYNTKKDDFLHGKFLSPSYSVNSYGELVFKKKQYHKEFLPPEPYLIVNDRICSFWNGFDKLLNLFQKWKSSINRCRDVEMRNDDIMLDRYKQLGLLK